MIERNLNNFAQTIITAPTSGLTTLIGTVVTCDTFPTTNFYATIEQVYGGEITEKEVVLCSTRTGTSFAVARGQDGTTAKNFSALPGVCYLTLTVVASHFEEIRDKLDTVDNDIDTVEAKPATSKTTPVDADSMRLWDSVVSNVKKFVTWANIKATLKTYFDTLYHAKNALRTGLTANKMLITDGTGAETYQEIPVTQTKIAGENITAGQILRYGIETAGEVITQSGGGATSTGYSIGYSATYHTTGQSFTLANGGYMTSILVGLKRTGSPTGDITMYLYNISDLTTAIFTSTNTISTGTLTTSYANYTFNFNGGYIPPGQYAMRLGPITSTSTSNYVSVEYHTNPGYAGGGAYSINSSGTRTGPNANDDIKFTITVLTTGETATSVYKAHSSSIHYSYILGFANNTATAGNNVYIDMTYSSKLTGLTKNIVYYLDGSSNSGGVRTTAGTVSVAVGRSISTTEMHINLFGR